MPNYVATTSVEGGIALSKYLLCHQNRLPILAVEVLSERGEVVSEAVTVAI